MKNPENKMSVSPSPTKKSSEPLIDVKNAQNYRQFMTSYSKSEDCYKINNSILLNRTIGDILYEQCSKKQESISKESGCEFVFNNSDKLGVGTVNEEAGVILELNGSAQSCTEAFLLLQEEIILIERSIDYKFRKNE